MIMIRAQRVLEYSSVFCVTLLFCGRVRLARAGLPSNNNYAPRQAAPSGSLRYPLFSGLFNDRISSFTGPPLLKPTAVDYGSDSGLLRPAELHRTTRQPNDPPYSQNVFPSAGVAQGSVPNGVGATSPTGSFASAAARVQRGVLEMVNLFVNGQDALEGEADNLQQPNEHSLPPQSTKRIEGDPDRFRNRVDPHLGVPALPSQPPFQANADSGEKVRASDQSPVDQFDTQYHPNLLVRTPNGEPLDVNGVSDVSAPELSEENPHGFSLESGRQHIETHAPSSLDRRGGSAEVAGLQLRSRRPTNPEPTLEIDTSNLIAESRLPDYNNRAQVMQQPPSPRGDDVGTLLILDDQTAPPRPQAHDTRSTELHPQPNTGSNGNQAVANDFRLTFPDHLLAFLDAAPPEDAIRAEADSVWKGQSPSVAASELESDTPPFGLENSLANQSKTSLRVS